MKNGTVSNPIYIIVNQSNIAGISRTGASPGWIISEGDGNFLQWNCGASNNSYEFPFGFSNTAYIPFTFNKTAGSTNVAVSTYGTIADNSTYSDGVTNMSSVWGGSATGSVIDRWWRVYATGNTATMTFSYRASENNTTSAPTGLTKSQQWNSTSAAWMTPIGTGSAGVTTGVGTVSSGATNSFASDKIVWILSRSDNPLPIELLTFNAKLRDTVVDIFWSTASEINSDYFIVQRTKYFSDTTDIATVDAAGISNTTLNYYTIDEHPLTGISYYRLKEVDYDGNTTYSEWVPIEYNIASGNTPTVNLLNIFPNPSNDIINIVFSSSQSSTVQISVFDISGKLIKKNSSDVNGTGNTIIQMNVKDLSNGIYFLQLADPNNNISGKFIKTD